jgi:membrane protein implicated in regulation of membrane protease activity
VRKRELIIDFLIVLGLALVAGGLWLAWGWPATLGFLGAALLTLGVLLAVVPGMRRTE